MILLIRTILRHVEQEGSGTAFRDFRIRKTAKRAVEQDGSLCARERGLRRIFGQFVRLFRRQLLRS